MLYIYVYRYLNLWLVLAYNETKIKILNIWNPKTDIPYLLGTAASEVTPAHLAM